MQVSNKIYNINRVSVNQIPNSQVRCILTTPTTDIFVSSNQNKSNCIKSNSINFCGLAKPVKTNSLEKIFQELYDFKGNNEDFAQLTFKRLKEHLGLKNVLTKDLVIEDIMPTAGRNNEGEFQWRTGEFSLNRSSLQGETKVSILGSIRHELEHYLQQEKIMRSEDIGIEKFLELDSQKELQKCKNDFFEAGISYSCLGSDEEFIKHVQSGASKDFWQNVIKKRGIIKSGSYESKKAFEYLKAHLEYPLDRDNAKAFLDFIEMPFKEPDYQLWVKDYKDEKSRYKYYTNLLETEAFKVEKNIQRKYLQFESKLTGKPFVISNEFEEFNKRRLNNFKCFENAFDQKISANLPENFRGFIYETLIQKLVDEGKSSIKYKDIARQSMEIDRAFILEKINLYEYLLKNSKINMYSQEEIDAVNKFIQEYKVSEN